jgi:hypothetical protein
MSQQPAVRIKHDAVDGERWTFGVHEMQPTVMANQVTNIVKSDRRMM